MTGVRALVRFQLKVLARIFCGFCVAALLFLGIGPRVLGYRTMTVLTGSMRPSYPPGSVVLVAQKPVTELHIGDVLAYQAPIEDHRVVTHRVTDIANDAEGYVVRTKGDANDGLDPWRARISSPTVWTVRFGVPVLGSLIRALRGPIVHRVLVFGLPFVVAMMWILEIWRSPAPTPQEAHA